MGVQALNVEGDGLADQALDLFKAAAGNSKARQLGSIGTEAAPTLLDDDRVPDHFIGPFNRACRRMLISVPGGTSVLGFPATVTVPGLMGGETGGDCLSA